MTFTASQRGEWPNGIHWTAGETRTIPAGYPGSDAPKPKWLKAPKKKAPKAKPQEG